VRFQTAEGLTTMKPSGAVANGQATNRLLPEDRAAHDWYRFDLSFPPHLVRDYLERFEVRPGQTVLDPFCGTGTTLVECKKRGIASLGIEAHPMAHFAAQVKTDWNISRHGLLKHANHVAHVVRSVLENQGLTDDPYPLLDEPLARKVPLRTLSAAQQGLILRGSISPLPLHKTLTLLQALEDGPERRCLRHELLALAKAVVQSVSNLHFGPEVGVGQPKGDVGVIGPWLQNVQTIADDLGPLEEQAEVPTRVHLGDARMLISQLEPGSVDVVITSPPYPNEKDYTRMTRLESVLLGFLETKKDLRDLKEHLMRYDTRNVFKGDQDDSWVRDHR